MGLNMRSDSDLEFLRLCKSEDMHPLVEIMTGKQNDRRISEELTAESYYQRYYPDHQQYWYLVAAELQCFGGNTFANIARGQGVPYREVLTDACSKMKVNFNKQAEIKTIEMNLLMTIMTKALDKMSPDQLREAADLLGLKTTSYTPEIIAIALQSAVNMSGFMAYQVALIVANEVAKFLLGRGLALATNAALTRCIGVFAGPIGWAVTALFTLWDVAGPAYRVTIPACIQVAYLRTKSELPES